MTRGRAKKSGRAAPASPDLPEVRRCGDGVSIEWPHGATILSREGAYEFVTKIFAALGGGEVMRS